ncbi:MAG: hypothetical protein J4469_00860 [Candidatus Aenigmarchaeota archaeon]|nr:hypothetical protein [Candidatus Aenigmarchaeota archaeon]
MNSALVDHMNPQILEKYKKMQDKFDLPHLNELKNTFKIEFQEDEKDEKLFEQIRLEISDKLFAFTEKIIEPIIGGAETFSGIFEQSMLTEAEREKLFRLYKKIQVLKWENNLLIMKPDERETAKWIKKTWDFWNNELEDELRTVCKKLSTSWQTLRFKDEKTTYLG